MSEDRYFNYRNKAGHHDSPGARSRSRSPRRRISERKRRHSRDEPQSKHAKTSQRDDPLPFGARTLDKHDFSRYRGIFSLYLEIQKQLILQDLNEREARGRWKSFLGKWNRGELAEGWYDPVTFSKAERSTMRLPSPQQSSPSSTRRLFAEDEGGIRNRENDNDSNEDDFGPNLPSISRDGRKQRSGAAVPSLQDLELQREQAAEDREAAAADLRHERRAYRKQEQVRLDELAPKAEAGTRERQVEKRREAAAANKAFAASKTDASGAMEMRDEDLMGGGDGFDDYQRRKKETEVKKNGRELRREEIFRARQAEREERVRAYREKEDKTMAGLIALAKQKFG